LRIRSAHERASARLPAWALALAFIALAVVGSYGFRRFAARELRPRTPAAGEASAARDGVRASSARLAAWAPLRALPRPEAAPGPQASARTNVLAFVADMEAAGSGDGEPYRARARAALVPGRELDAAGSADLNGAVERFTSGLVDVAGNLDQALEQPPRPETASARAELLILTAQTYARALEEASGATGADARDVRAFLAAELPLALRDKLRTLTALVAESEPYIAEPH
jgi:hypothetical protein